MKAAVSELRRELADLRAQIGCFQVEWELLRRQAAGALTTNAEELLSSLVQTVGSGAFRRKSEYNSVVVTLYGAFERFLENLAVAYLRRLNALIPRYAQLPKPVIENHVEATTTLLARPDLQKYRGLVTAASLVENLHSCLSGGPGYRINAEAFTHHTANFRTENIDQFFGRIGISTATQRIRSLPRFQQYLRDAALSDRLQASELNAVFFEVNDLAERRNEVAHGTPGQILSNEFLSAYIDFIESYSVGVFELLYAESLRYEVSFSGRDVGAPIAVFNNHIVCLRLSQVSVAVGDRLVASTNDPNLPFVEGEILEVQVDHEPYQQLVCRNSTAVALRTDFRAKQSHRFFLLEPAATPWELA